MLYFDFLTRANKFEEKTEISQLLSGIYQAKDFKCMCLYLHLLIYAPFKPYS